MGIINTDKMRFIAGGGEMGKLTREKDWSKTSLGLPEFWPQSLRTTLSIILNSKFPMFLFWGQDLICFYNDAYRPSLGKEGRHPAMLGMKGKDAWPDIWNVIKPLLDQVLDGGESTWSEDQLIPIYRNGTIEDVYFTFSYSPVNDESGLPAGVFVTCHETTEKVIVHSKLEESKNELEFAIEAAELGTWDYNPSTNTFTANERLKKWFGIAANEEIELAHVINAIHDGDRQRVTNAIQTALDYSSGGNYDVEYVILHPHSKKETIVHAKGRAWFNNDKIAWRFNGTMEDVTERVAARKQVETGEARFRSLINQSPVAMVVLNGPEHVIEIANSAMLKRWGKTGQNLESKRLIDVFPEIIGGPVPGLLDGVFNTGIVYRETEAVSYIQHNNPAITAYNDFEYSPLREADGRISGVIATVSDVTEKVNARKKIEESEKQFRLLANSMPQHIWTADSEGNLNYFNKSVYEYSGLLPEQLYVDGWLQIVHPDDRQKNIREWLYSVKTGNDFLLEHRFRKFDGEYRWQLSRATAHRDENGKIQMWVGSSTDIQDQKNFSEELEQQVEERTKELIFTYESLKRSEERYHLMVEEVQDYSIIYLNQKGIIENWNIGAEKIKGYKAEEIIGKSFSTFYTAEDKKNNLPLKLLTLAIKTGRAGQEGWRVRKNGELFWANVVITAVHNDKNEIIGFSKVTHDLTEKKEADDIAKKSAEILEKNNIELEKMNKELQSFAYISSHDLQEPLRKIQTFASRISETEAVNLSDKGLDYFKRMQDAAFRMQTLINDLLVYSRTATSERKFQYADLNEIVDEVKGDLREELEQKHVMIDSLGLAKVNIIPFQFRQLLHNLVSNSLKFARPEIAPCIVIRSEICKGDLLKCDRLSEDVEYCHISFSDNGIGFEPHFKDKIFELFQRLHGRQEYNGTGIGLAIVKKIVENHHGVVTATGELGKGATFDIYIPFSHAV
ncbi:hypothetical protein CJD36_003370 [Flavipsychrobacter stenotrophus]|uniref:histidine kinase n=1 Tax=Flavipsychrobacter stenotrophus TaxID=2077091 RepID=A0A2S7T0T5_9BACT|nr:PAS domain S-box protein [Flavipsychrobacter stenotrophus]PQJ12800.1 hypothetical protein CJD36_003370 [Flavipsychrobacter stenotrophus]